jgi:RNA polymerase sigma-70 factor, ECF subfamily
MLGRAGNKIGKPTMTAASLHDCVQERQLVAAAKSGDKLAFESLFKRHQRRIFVLALRYTRVREDAEDVVQLTFLKAFVHLQNFEGKSSFSTWATRIAINQALMLLRARRTLRDAPIDASSSAEGSAPLEIADASLDPEASYSQKEEARILSAAMGRLRPGMRTAIQLKELGELSNRETAGRMGVSVGTVKARVFHARRKLGETLRRCMRSRRFRESDILATAGNANHSPQNRMTCNA